MAIGRRQARMPFPEANCLLKTSSRLARAPAGSVRRWAHR